MSSILLHRILNTAAVAVVLLAAVFLLLLFNGRSSGSQLQRWHEEKLSEEFTADLANKKVNSFADYLELERRLFKQLDEEIYARSETGPDQALNRFSPGSTADPRGRQPNWNRSFELEGRGAGGVLLLHGMSDSPYSLRALGLELNRQGYHVIGLRLPGHGTAPSGMKYLSWRDMAAAVDLAMAHLSSGPDAANKGVHMVGYSTGASLALDYTLRVIDGKAASAPASLVLISPAIRIHRAAKLAGFKNSLSAVPGLGGMAWMDVMDEFDPYKYNSFATNAGAQVHGVTADVDRRISALAGNAERVEQFPPVLVLKSAVDSTVTTDAVVDHLLKKLPAGRNELVIFDINRHAAVESTLLVSDPGPLTKRLMAENGLPFAVTFISNENRGSLAVVARYKDAMAHAVSSVETLGFAWPKRVVSLSHVAMPFPPDDPLYGQSNPPDDFIYLGDLALRGERGLLKMPAGWLLRMRHNPFYGYLEARVVDWLEKAGPAK